MSEIHSESSQEKEIFDNTRDKFQGLVKLNQDTLGDFIPLLDMELSEISESLHTNKDLAEIFSGFYNSERELILRLERKEAINAYITKYMLSSVGKISEDMSINIYTLSHELSRKADYPHIYETILKNQIDDLDIDDLYHNIEKFRKNLSSIVATLVNNHELRWGDIWLYITVHKGYLTREGHSLN